jgi:hypothetical protein
VVKYHLSVYCRSSGEVAKGEFIMTKEKIEAITRLAEEAHRTSEWYKALSAQNADKTFEDRKKQLVAYALATAEMIEANRLLDNEIGISHNSLVLKNDYCEKMCELYEDGHCHLPPKCKRLIFKELK